MKKLKKINQSLLSMMLVLAMTATMLIAAPVKEAKAAYAAPTETTTLEDDEHPGVADVATNVSGATVSYQVDDNDEDNMYIRIMLPTTATVDSLKKLAVTLTTDGTALTSTSASFKNSEANANVYTCDSLDLYNKSYTVVFGDTKYILAAGIASAKIDVPVKETDVITNAQLDGYATTMKRDIIESDYMGNPYFDQMGYQWTSVTYIMSATLPNDTNRSAVKLTYTLNRADGTPVTLDLTSGMADTKINDIKYNVTASFGDVITITKDNYSIDMTELMNYLKDGGTTVVVSNYIVRQFAAILQAQDDYFALGAHTFPAGTTVMDVMQDFLNFAYGEEGTGATYCRFNEKSSRGKDCVYIDYINGLSYREVNNLSGWMYTDESTGLLNADGSVNYKCSIPGVMSNAYTMTKDTRITWFYTTNFTLHN